MGWAKATKLEGRSTQQGLIGVLVQKNIGALIEVNCETDFVARNKNFQEFVEKTSRACVNHLKNMPANDVLSKIEFQGESLKNLVLEDGKMLVDQLALLIGTVGENASLRRATCFKASDSIKLTGFTHPSPADLTNSENEVQIGKYGSIVAFKSENEVSDNIKKNLCQQIVGMNPSKIGDKEKDEPSVEKDDEKCLIHQEYLLDPSITVGTLLENNNIEIVDFQRFECGENLGDEKEEVATAASVN